MQAIRVHEFGGPEVMRLEEMETPGPGPGQARVRVEAAGVNFIDIYHRTGLYPNALPLALGQRVPAREASALAAQPLHATLELAERAQRCPDGQRIRSRGDRPELLHDDADAGDVRGQHRERRARPRARDAGKRQLQRVLEDLVRAQAEIQ